MKKIIDWIIDKWLAGFLTALFFFMLKLYIELPPEKKSNFFNFRWFNAIINTEIKLWQAIIAFTFILLMFFVSKKWRNMKGNSSLKSTIKPNIASSYRVDSFGTDNSKWTWNYEWENYEKKYIVIDVVPLCPVCNTKMEIDSYVRTRATCAKCRLEGRHSSFIIKQDDGDVAKEIIRRLNSGEWKDRINN